jgi:DNA uptake protein ComE-like DNA-binding protein
MTSLKSHFVFNRSQRGGILLLVLFITGLLLVYHFYDFSEDDVLDVSSSEVMALQKELDSLSLAETEERKPKQYPFNPNYITDFKAYTLGMSSEEFDRLKDFRSRDRWINSVSDFKKVTGISDSLLNEISPLFKFPKWVTNPKPKFNNYKQDYDQKGFSEKSYAQKIDLNFATREQLEEVSGIGEALSKRIILYREKLGGFSSDVQLSGIWGMNEEVVKRTLNLFTVKTPKEINKMNINSASASDIATIPGISFDLAKEIWEFRKLRDRIDSFSELEKIESLSTIKLKLIQLYLYIE